MKYLFFTLLVLGLSCKITKNTTEKDVLKLGSEFEVIKMENSKVEVQVKPTIKLNFSSNTVSGNAGCNNYNGKILRKGSQLKFTNLVATKMYCGNMKMEKEFMQKLTLVTSFDVKDNLFLLYNNAKELVLTCEPTVK